MLKRESPQTKRHQFLPQRAKNTHASQQKHNEPICAQRVCDQCLSRPSVLRNVAEGAQGAGKQDGEKRGVEEQCKPEWNFGSRGQARRRLHVERKSIV